MDRQQPRWQTRRKTARGGFTLSELVIALGLIALIAALVVPKILSSSNNAQLNATARDALTLVSGAFAEYEMDQAPASGMDLNDLIPYLTYSKDYYGQAAVTLDAPPQGTDVTAFGCGTSTCSISSSGTVQAIQLKSGAIIALPRTITFNGTTGNRALPFLVDPDGRATGSMDSVEFWLYQDGTIKSVGTLTASTLNSAGSFSAKASGDPSYLNF